MMTLVFLLEEPSARELLKGLMPRLVPADWSVRYLVFEGKQDLEKQLTLKLRGWMAPDSLFVVMRDQDMGDCREVKAGLIERVTASGKTALVRIACRELEAWVAGDLEALAAGFGKPSMRRYQSKSKFRDPDNLGHPIDDLRSLVPEYQKVSGARAVGPHLDPARSSSTSFRVFCEGVTRLVQQHST